ncbi:GTP binding protein 4 [Salpingoeca rosetta]|uniref:Nucleolar GTP-binding protein 1 n=1 Tax=Salpingoeca rosetta (strain ATCC 50818 / BSB-021) TaxID=946362 RepID=F2U4V6_SALR5|nr:GTP binding protein 4 [Salpingoeca rosetta]EGD82672.1 GTP binding protein 4 [Salpingoeca rosetta]|eukprot:XP_004995908.1 GTP binding protein 4 [Salpingoeca rosetta]
MSGKAYNFKSITVVPKASDFVDIVLSKTQRKTPTVVHKGYAISRIRNFYVRKVKFTAQSFHDKLDTIITEFPKLDDVHPFYADLMNVLYDKDHYKIALGQINSAKHMIDNLAKDYVRLLKYGDSLYRCKQLKRAALGRMATLMRKHKSSLEYLEQVRQHLSRLPSIDPNTRTLLVTGFPNVGKSSFVNKVTRADVEVQPYAFTTKSLFVGHTDYQYLRWQVIDTPGILDHPLEQRNTIEMQAITALAHLRACVLYVMDLSQQCGFTVEQQFSLFENIKPLFAKKPLAIIVNKADTMKIEDAPAEVQERLKAYEAEGISVLSMSTLTEEGVAQVKNAACDKLMTYRIESKTRNPAMQASLNKLNVTLPRPRDNKARPAFIPEGALNKRMGRVPTKGRTQREQKKQRNEERKELLAQMPKRKLARDLQEELREEYSVDLRKEWDLEDASWRYDEIPEILDGKNVADFVDPDIDEKLRQLEEEEASRKAAGEYDSESEDEDTKAVRARALLLRERRNMFRVASQRKSKRNAPVLPIKIRRRLAEAEERRLARLNRPKHATDDDDGDSDYDEDTRGRSMDADEDASRAASRSRSRTPLRAKSKKTVKGVAPEAAARRKKPVSLRAAGGVQSSTLKKASKKMQRLGFRKINYMGRQGEADRHIHVKMPKFLYTGKRGVGKADYR